MGFFDKLKKIVSKDTFEDKKEKDLYDKGFEKTRKEFTDKLNKLNKKYSKVNSEYFEELEEILIKKELHKKHTKIWEPSIEGKENAIRRRTHKHP